MLDFYNLFLNNLLSYLVLVSGGVTVAYVTFYIFTKTRIGVKLIVGLINSVIKEINEQISSAEESKDILEPIIIINKKDDDF
jgi:phage-related tail protein